MAANIQTGARAVKEAEALDAQGRHQEAINVLSRAAGTGDVQAKTRIGLRILTGDRAPHLPPQGAGLLEDAAREGGAEAAMVCATLAGIGAWRPQSWRDALDHLLRAATLGWAPAQEQLGLLARLSARRRGGAAESQPEDRAPNEWAALRRGVDIEFLLIPPAAQTGRTPDVRTLSEDPAIRSFPGFAEPEICAWLIARAHGRLRRAQIYDPAALVHRVDDIRTNTSALFGLSEADLVQVMLQARIARATGAPFAHLEACSVLHYQVGQEFRDHYDFVDPSAPGYAQDITRNGQRVTTFLVYLNEDYEGGETAFPRLDITHHGRTGEGLAFANALADDAPDTRTLHAGRSPSRGEKWVLSQWIRSRPILPGATPAR